MNEDSDPTRKTLKKSKLEKTLQLPIIPNPESSFPKTPCSNEIDEDVTEAKMFKKTERSISGVSEKDREIFEYIESLQTELCSKSAAECATLSAERAYDHLEQVYKLMERVVELRQQNFKLQRRIRDLEHFTEANSDDPNLDFRGRQIGNLSGFSTPRRRGSTPNAERKFADPGENSSKQSKVSKWTKVKAAFRWEKASNVGDSKSQDSGIHVPVNYEVARYLRVPSTSDEMGHSPGDSGAGISTPGTISSASSNDDLRTGTAACEDLRSSDEDHFHYHLLHHSKVQYRRQKSHGQKYHRTPWAKMKDIIHPRQSLKKKHRLSAASDDIQIDVEFCSDNEDVFETDDTGNKSTNISLSPSPNVYSSSASPSGSEIPSDVIERYQRILMEDRSSGLEVNKSLRRWDCIRKAFLSRHYTPESHKLKPKTQKSNVQEEIQKNYKELQKKLSLEFQEKIYEWERLKQASPVTPGSPAVFNFNDESLQSSLEAHRRGVTKENNLPEDFKKKLQEWEKIKKRSARGSGRGRKKLGEITKWKSLGGPRSSDHSPVFEYPQISDDFRKKMEEWKQIKAAGGPLAHAKAKDKTPSPKLSRKNSSQKQSKKRKQHNKELHWFDKELGKIEKEKQRLEREKDKFVEREERLSKLRRSMIGSHQKREILVHTPSGYHRFEGISRKFTQKLYEWEKSQGIAPEASTFALLSSSCAADVEAQPGTSKENNSAIPRSKSADSIAISTLNLGRPLLSGHPSSLSLNDMDELEKDCLIESKDSSLEDLDLDELLDDDNLETDEPEAMLVEVEDYEEETTEPLHISCAERQQLPVYQREEFKPLCESQTLVVPKVRRSESAKAQINYDLMESIVKLLTELQVTEDEIRALAEAKNLLEESNIKTFKFLNELQSQSSKNLGDSILKLEEANTHLARNLRRDDREVHSNLAHTLGSVLEGSAEMLQMTDQMSSIIASRATGDSCNYKSTIFEQIKKIRGKISELRRHLCFISASEGSSATRRTVDVAKSQVAKTISSDSKENDGYGSEASRKSSGRHREKERRYVKMEPGITNLSVSTGAVKKRIYHRQKSANKPIVTDTDEDENADCETDSSKTDLKPHRKLTRTKSITDQETIPKLDPRLTAPMTLHFGTDSPISGADSPVTLLVKTTRKLFTPFVETSLGRSNEESNNPFEFELVNAEEEKFQASDEAKLKSEIVKSLPPLPPSPLPQRKIFKDVSPSIKMIIAKYNQNLEQAVGLKSGGSSGSNSPVAWRSPVSERRSLHKLSPLMIERNQVQKSSSATLISKHAAIRQRKISLDMRDPSQSSETRSSLTLDISLAQKKEGKEVVSISPEVRMRRLQKAKEEFLKTPVSAPCPLSEDGLQYPQRNRLSQISVESDFATASSPPSRLTKSVSVGMINVEPDVYMRINSEFHAEGYVSLPRQSNTQPKEHKSAFSSIAAKFRKVKMRKGKNKDKDKKVVATLCRQSLVVDINDDQDENSNSRIIGETDISRNGDVKTEEEGGTSRRASVADNETTPQTSTPTWLRRSLFKR
ncbi:myosin-11 isoform X2 [Euwallacea similis]|uniref:myosin-11 isoform X2 n=1 Tax=Euwallacea similis TaxID=1736056 RepID=UPI00345009F7